LDYQYISHEGGCIWNRAAFAAC